MKTSKTYILCALFSLLAASQALAQDIVGAWTRSGTTPEGTSVVVFLADGTYYNFGGAGKMPNISPYGYERGTYTWNPATGALIGIRVRGFVGGDGAGQWSSKSGVTLNLSGDIGILTVPGFGIDTLTRVTGASPMVGVWSMTGDSYSGVWSSSCINCITPDRLYPNIVVFLPNGIYLQATSDGIEHGTYSWHPTGGFLWTPYPATILDTISDDPGLSSKVGWGARVSADGLTLAIGNNWFVSYEFTRVGAAASTAPVTNYQGMWVVPKLAESGWGINFTHQGDLIFATWFTYDAGGKPWWLTMTAQQQADGSYAGAIDRTTGPPFGTVPFDSSRVTHLTVGTGRLTFTDATNATFAYNVNAISQTKALTRFQVAEPVPMCEFDSTLAPSDALNYQDMWVAPNLAEAGWGINLTHQGDLIFATWFTYDANGDPLWVSGTLTKSTRGVYSGALYATIGPPFDSTPFDPSRVSYSTVGTAKVTFTDGANGTLAYTLRGISQTKALTRFVFRGRGTVCY